MESGSGITAIHTPKAVRSLGLGILSRGKALSLDSLPAKLTMVGPYAFQGCVGLKGLKVPASVEEIASTTFHGIEVELPAGAAGGEGK